MSISQETVDRFVLANGKAMAKARTMRLDADQTRDFVADEVQRECGASIRFDVVPTDELEQGRTDSDDPVGLARARQMAWARDAHLTTTTTPTTRTDVRVDDDPVTAARRARDERMAAMGRG